MGNSQLTRHIQYMKKITATTILILIFTTCTNSKRNNINDCEIISDFYSDKLKVELINSVVFATTAILVQGTFIDRETKEPLINAEVKLYNNKMNFFSKTNSSGEFKIYENIKPGKWDLLIKHTNYNCMIIKDLIKSGGQWFIFKLNQKKVSENSSQNQAEKEYSLITDTIKCNTEIVLRTLNKIDSLSESDIRLFLKVFSPKCRNNVEFSEFSNELLFKVLEKHPDSFISVICNSKLDDNIDFNTIYEELKSPLHDLIPIERIKSAIESTSFKCERADSTIKALTIASESM